MAVFNYNGVTVHVADGVELPVKFVPVASAAVQEPSEPVEPKEPAGPGVPEAPAKSASRGDWAKYAETVGVEPGDLTRDQLIQAVADRDSE